MSEEPIWIDEGYYTIISCQSILIESNGGHIEASEGDANNEKLVESLKNLGSE